MVTTMSAVADLEDGLQAMRKMKAPGVSGTRIAGITTLCVNNVQSESVLVQKLFTHFKKTPGTHKLGVLYVVDSVTRKWLDQAKMHGQPINAAAQDGTYAAGVHRVTELMPSLVSDIMATAPQDQKGKIKKLVDIWEKGQTFAPAMLTSFREKLDETCQAQPIGSTTPPGSPPRSLMASLGVGAKPIPAPAPASVPNIMETLAKIARQNKSVAALPSIHNLAGPPAPAPTSTFLTRPRPQPAAQPLNFAPPQPMALAPAQSAPPLAVAPTPNLAGVLGALGGLASVSNNGAAHPPPAAAAMDSHLQQQLALVTTLASQGIPIDKISAILSQVKSATSCSAPPAYLAASAPAGPPPPVQSGYVAAGPDDRDRNGLHDTMMRSPIRPRARSRSRSPGRRWDTHASSPRGARGHDGAAFDYGIRPDDRDSDRGRERVPDPYRQRSPPARRPKSPRNRSPSQQDKWVEYDDSLPKGCIKVYSRTLFVGGVTCSESELGQIMGQFGRVQTCIVNKEKRHAFVKMFLRRDAEIAKRAMEEGSRFNDQQLRTRWGVGFGPRDCSDYQTGVSVIPIHKLTEADRKWMLTAPFGGSGGAPIQPGLCVEEPDIEIGAGVSSKAISRRMQTDKGGNHGPKSSRRDDELGHGHSGHGHGHGGGGGKRWKRNHQRSGGDRRRDNRQARPDHHEENLEILGFPPGVSMGRNGLSFGAKP